MTFNKNKNVEIFIAEDSPTQSVKLQFILEQQGFSVATAANGRAALEAIRAHVPTLVISDIMMPELDGYGLCRAIKSDDNLKGIPVILLTALSDPRDVILGLECGADNFIRKPYDDRYLLARIDYLLMNRELRKSQRMQFGVEIDLAGHKHFITADRQQILDLLISTYEQAVIVNSELIQRDQELAHSNQVLQGLYRIAEGLNQMVSERAVAETTLERALELPGIQAGWMLLLDEAGFRVAATRNLPPILCEPGAFDGDCVCKRRSLIGELEHSTNILECERLHKLPGDAQGLRYHASVPLLLGDRLLGLMNLVGPQERLFNEEELSVLHGLGKQVAVALERARLHEHLEHLVEERTAKLVAEVEQRRQIQEAQARLVAIIEATPDLVSTTSPEGHLLYVNQTGLRMLGLQQGADLSGMHAWDLSPEWAAKLVMEEGIPHAIQHGTWSGETAILGADHQEIPILQVIIAHKNPDGTLAYLSTIAHDISKRKKNEGRILRLNRMHAVLSGINTTIIRVSELQELFNEACRIAVDLGKFSFAWIGLLEADGHKLVPTATSGLHDHYLAEIKLSPMTDEPEKYPLLIDALTQARPVVCNDVAGDDRMLNWRSDALRYGHRAVAVLPLMLEQKPVGVFVLYSPEAGVFDDEEMTVLIEMAGDISFAMDHIKKVQRLDYLAYFDAVTGLPNRTLFLDRVGQRISTASREQHEFYVIMLNLARFSRVNETFGHQAGDELLRQVAQRLQDALDDTYLLAHLPADCFCIATKWDIDGSISQILDKVFSCIQDKAFMLLDQEELRVLARAGVSVYPADGANSESLLRNAEAAMKMAKTASGKSLFYAPAFNAQVAEKLAMENKLRKALEQGQLLLHYQPKVDLANGQICGFEALMRWLDPDAGLVSPAQFIPVLEETGMIIEAGAWALTQAIMDYRAWQQQGLTPPRIAVNVSQIQLQRDDFVHAMKRILERAGDESVCIEIEITESIMMQEVDASLQKLKAIKAMGVEISIDDFGTGYSSLSYLKRFPATSVKIDQSFIRDVTTDPDNAALVRSIISMAHELRLCVIAEGVETKGQAHFLSNHHCDEVQGYYCSRPIPAAECAALLQQQAAGSSLLKVGTVARERTLLLVDDEPNITTSIRRLMRGEGYRILTADSGKQGLELLATNDVGVIVSDQRMPEMTGVEFFRLVKGLYPDTVRIVLSGYTDLKSVTDAINEGAIYKFLTKPWEDEQLLENVREAFQRYELKAENTRLALAVQRSNAELSEINRDLELRVLEKAEEISHSTSVLKVTQEVLESLPNAMIGVDDDGLIVIANQAANRLFCGANGSLLGLTVDECPMLQFQAYRDLANGLDREITLADGRIFTVVSHRMGAVRQSAGTIFVFSASTNAAP